jgi:hypothetical protein
MTDFSELADEIWELLKRNIPEEDRFDAAEELVDVFNSQGLDIEDSDLQRYVDGDADSDGDEVADDDDVVWDDDVLDEDDEDS